AAVLGMGCLVLVLTLLGCSANSSACDRAAGLVGQGKLAEAARAYAAAQRKDDSRCAREGLQRVAKLQADALTEVAKGRAAEAAGDLGGAKSAYQGSLRIEDGSADAAAGLRRVTRRPATIDPVWFRAQRLYDEGYPAEARAEVVAVLRAHPDRTVPQSLARLGTLAPGPTPSRAATPTPSPVPGGATSTKSGVTSWLPAALVLVAAAAGAWWLGRRWHQAFNRIRAETDRLRVASAELDSALQAESTTLQDTRSVLEGLRQKMVAADRAISKNSADTLALTRRADEIRLLIQRLDDAMDRQQAQLTHILWAMNALRPGTPTLVVQHYAAPATADTEEQT